MKIKQLRKELQKIEEEHGNLEVNVGCDYEGRNPEIFFYKKDVDEKIHL